MVLKELILTVSNLGGCGGLERIDLKSLYFGGECGGLEITDLTLSTFGWVWWS